MDMTNAGVIAEVREEFRAWLSKATGCTKPETASDGGLWPCGGCTTMAFLMLGVQMPTPLAATVMAVADIGENPATPEAVASRVQAARQLVSSALSCVVGTGGALVGKRSPRGDRIN